MGEKVLEEAGMVRDISVQTLTLVLAGGVVFNWFETLKRLVPTN